VGQAGRGVETNWWRGEVTKKKRRGARADGKFQKRNRGNGKTIRRHTGKTKPGWGKISAVRGALGKERGRVHSSHCIPGHAADLKGQLRVIKEKKGIRLSEKKKCRNSTSTGCKWG